MENCEHSVLHESIWCLSEMTSKYKYIYVLIFTLLDTLLYHKVSLSIDFTNGSDSNNAAYYLFEGRKY